jgi:hypothetical protein
VGSTQGSVGRTQVKVVAVYKGESANRRYATSSNVKGPAAVRCDRGRLASGLPSGACHLTCFACRSLIGFFVALRMHLRSWPRVFRHTIYSHSCG